MMTKEWLEVNSSHWYAIESAPYIVRYSYQQSGKTLTVSLGKDVVQGNGFDHQYVKVFTDKYYNQLLLKKVPQTGYKVRCNKGRYYITFKFPQGIIRTNPGYPKEAEFQQTADGIVINLH